MGVELTKSTKARSVLLYEVLCKKIRIEVMGINSWFLGLEIGRQNALAYDKWMLADAAWNAALDLAEKRVNELALDDNTIKAAISVIRDCRES